MNLHGIVSGVIGAVNPHIIGTVQYSTGSTKNAAYERVPTYTDPVVVTLQVQALTSKDLRQIDGLNLNGTQRSIYVYGRIDGVVRSISKGGDLITITDGVNAGVWLVNLVSEQWSDGGPASWAKCVCTLQNEPAS